METIITQNDAAGYRILAHFWQKAWATFPAGMRARRRIEAKTARTNI
jgi:hypothetical protein